MQSTRRGFFGAVAGAVAAGAVAKQAVASPPVAVPAQAVPYRMAYGQSHLLFRSLNDVELGELVALDEHGNVRRAVKGDVPIGIAMEQAPSGGTVVVMRMG